MVLLLPIVSNSALRFAHLQNKYSLLYTPFSPTYICFVFPLASVSFV